jgi:hypothetical protein
VIDLGFAKYLGEPESKQPSDDADKHPPNKERSNHQSLLSDLVAGKAEQMPPVVHKFMHIHARKD